MIFKSHKEKDALLHLLIFSLFLPSFIMLQDFLFYHFLLPEGLPIANIRVGLLATNSFNFYLSEDIFISSLFLKDSFVQYKICGRWFFFFPHLKNIVPLLSWPPQSNPLSVWCHFLQSVKTFVFLFDFQMFNMVCLGMDFFGFIFFGVYSASSICMFVSFTKFEDFSVIIFPCSLSAPLSFFPLWGTPMILILDLSLLSYRFPWFYLFFLNQFFSLLFSFAEFYHLVSSSMIKSSHLHYHYWAHPLSLLAIIALSSIISTWKFLWLYIFAEIFDLLLYLQVTYKWLLKHFYYRLKSLSGNSSIWFIYLSIGVMWWSFLIQLWFSWFLSNFSLYTEYSGYIVL